MLKLESVFARLLMGTICSQVENTIYLSSYRLHPNSWKAQMMFKVYLTFCVSRQGIVVTERRSYLRSYYQ